MNAHSFIFRLQLFHKRAKIIGSHKMEQRTVYPINFNR